MPTHRDMAKVAVLGKRQDRVDDRVDAWVDDQCQPYRLHCTAMEEIDKLQHTTKKLKQENDKLIQAFDLVYETLQSNQKQNKSLRNQFFTQTAYNMHILCVHAAVFGEMQKHASAFEARISALEARMPADRQLVPMVDFRAEQEMQKDINVSQLRRIEALEDAVHFSEM